MTTRHAHIKLPPGTWSMSTARTTIRDALTAWGFDDPERLQPTELVATELVANAIRHVGEDFTLHIFADPATVTLAVQDCSPAIPVRRAPDEHGGRGLMVVEHFSTCWGYDRYPGDGKRVWARLDW